VSSHLHSLAASTPPPFQNNKQGAHSEGALTGVRALALLHVIAQHAVILASARGSDISSPALFSAAAAAGSSPRAEQQFFTSWLAQPVMAGDVGVDAFFVLSGCGGPNKQTNKFACWVGGCWLLVLLLMLLADNDDDADARLRRRASQELGGGTCAEH
jgi:hypothetical protein